MAHWLLAALHLLALGVGMGAVWMRGLSLRHASEPTELQRVFRADTMWGIAALVWLSTGLARAFAGYGKGVDFYLNSQMFHLKMGLLALILLLEAWPMLSLLRWRLNMRQGVTPRLSAAPALARISFAQALILVLMVFAATAMARAIG